MPFTFMVTPQSFTLEDLGLAYRKAKVDLYYSSHASLLEIAEYESHLAVNLKALLEKLNGTDEDWVKQEDFLGGWTVAPKSIDKKTNEGSNSGLIIASPAEEWAHSIDFGSGEIVAEFRLMAQCSMDFHVLSSLWLLKVGKLYDKKLNECAYGSRLRRGENGDVNPLSLGSFKPYLKPFRDWRDGGIKAMGEALTDQKKVVAITADVSSFYHELNAGFMLDEKFMQLFELTLTPEQDKLNGLFISALDAWAQNTPLKKGLPVGLPASAVVANMALIELDRLIEQQVAPLYYGRYVDDILLVMENGARFSSTAQLWEWLFDRADGNLGWVDATKKDEIQFQPTYLKDSQIRFANAKNKVFLLSGSAGKNLVDAISQQIHQRASEWRALPCLPESASHIATDLLPATNNDGETADSLRKTDALTMHRAGFALKLRDFEAYERDLPPDTWKDHRHAFFNAVIEHLLAPKKFFELAQYLPRIVRLATACEDFVQLHGIVEALEKLVDRVKGGCVFSIKALGGCDKSEVQDAWQKQLFGSVYESVLAAFPPRLSKVGKAEWQSEMTEKWKSLCQAKDHSAFEISDIQAGQAWLFAHDLAHMPFRFIGLPKEMIAQRGIPAKSTALTITNAEELLPDEITSGVGILREWLKFKRGLPRGLLFATRPYNLAELFVLAKDPFEVSSQHALQAVVLALRGFTLTDKTPQWDKQRVLQIPDGKLQAKRTIAVSSWKTDYNSWVASVMRQPDPDIRRYRRLNQLVNGMISQPDSAKYFILPELALPAHWFMRIALKLQARGISLITGIEYFHVSKGRVRHQVWAALSHDGLGFPSTMIYRQDKQKPALHEELELQRLAGLELKPEIRWLTPPVIQHGDFRFALLVCSELTNISYRSALRGQIDALFVPEWNQDIETFNALVESAALDIHAYIIQCNDRQYGDSRIRAPYKDGWKRNVLRVKGGIHDYCVTGEIDVQALRQFQSSHRSPSGPFKPVPDGFSPAHARKTLPKGGE